MKKALSVILSLLMLFTLYAPASADASAAGTWYLIYYIRNESVYYAATLGVSMTLELNPDGSAYAVAQTDETELPASGTWTQNDADVLLYLDDDAAQLAQYDGDTLTIINTANPNQSIIYFREPLDFSPIALSTPDMDATLADYVGAWECLVAETDGTQQSLASLGMALTLTITQDAVEYTLTLEESESMTIPFTPVMTASTLTLESDIMSMPPLQLLENDVLLWQMDDSLCYYLTRVPETVAP